MNEQVSIEVEPLTENKEKEEAVKGINKRAFDVFQNEDVENKDLKDSDQNNQ